MKFIIWIIAFLSLGTFTSAQFYEFGQDPASLKWKQLDTEHFRIVFPIDFRDNAQSLALIMEKNYHANSAQLNHQPKKLSLIIHNQTVYSNAFVTWAPKRMEFFTFPDPDMYPNDWLSELSLHEFRHVIQIDKLNHGFTRILSFILGQQATGVTAGLMPLWFIEGDAVFAETSLSNSGRGRLPSFEMEIKTKLLSGTRPFSLSKSYLGSYRDFVPDYYRLGYQMVSFARIKYGNDYWTNALDYVSHRPFLISPYYFYSKKLTGGGQTLLYKATMDSLKEQWTNFENERDPEIIPSLNFRNSKVYTNYKSPSILVDSSVIALKTGLDIIPRFVKISPSGTEQTIFVPGSLVSGRVSVYNDKILWDEYVQDVRWKNRSYSILKEYDINTGKCRRLSQKSKLLSPSWSPNGDSILAVNVSKEYCFSLVIINSANGQVIDNISSPENYYLQYPVWIKGTKKIAVIATGEKGKKILEYDLQSKEWTELLNSNYTDINQLESCGDFLFFTGEFTGSDDIYSYNFRDLKLRKCTNSSFGAFQPDVSKDCNLLAYSSYGLNGFDIVLKPFFPGKQEEITIDEGIKKKHISSIEINSENCGISAKSVYEEKPYHKLTHLINVHSWAPYWFDYLDPNIDDPQVSAGLTLLSQNELSTAFSSLGYERTNGYNYLHAHFTYKGLLPIFDFSSTYGGSPAVAAITGVPLPKTDPNVYTTLSTYIPLTFSSGRIISGIQPSLQLTYSSTYYFYFSDSTYSKGIVFTEPRIYFYSYLRTSLRDIQPRLGLTLDAKYTAAPFENELYGNNKSLRISLYLPGVIRNQGLKLRGEWQNQDVDSYYLQNHLYLPRGYAPRIFISMNRYSADYSFPILYPDYSLSSLLYLKRIRGNFFVDYMKGIEQYISPTKTSNPEYPLSQGLELFADYHIFRFIFEFSSGLRLMYFPHENKFGAQMLFTVNLDKF
jgi:hypothetical protein